MSDFHDEQSRLHQKHFGHPFAYGCCGPPGQLHHQQYRQPQPPAPAPVDPEPYPVVIERVPQRPRAYNGPWPGGDPKAQAWKHYGMQWLLGLGFLAVIVVFVTIYNLATGEW